MKINHYTKTCRRNFLHALRENLPCLFCILFK